MVFKNLVFYRLKIMGLFFVLMAAYSVVAYRAPAGVFNSPDEMANAFFTKTIREDSQLQVFEPLESVTNNLVHPRSIAVRGNYLVPGSFHGLPVFYGLLSKITGMRLVLFFTATIAALGIFAWFAIMRALFGSRAAWISAVLLAITPAYWYYANRGLYHNVLFTALLIFACYFTSARPLCSRAVGSHTVKKIVGWIDPLLGGLFWGAAAWVRTVELPWMVLATVALWIVFRKKMKWMEMFIWGTGALLMLTALGLANQSVYGSVWWSGYTFPSGSVPISSETTALVSSSLHRSIAPSLDFVSRLVFPFGIHPRTALSHVADFYVRLPWWMSAVLIASVLLFVWNLIQKKSIREERVCMLLFLGVTGWLVLVYGSWIVRDNPDPNAITVGNSYLRYWLPSYVLGTAISGMAFRHITVRFKKIQRWLIAGVGVALICASGWLVFFSSNDSIVPMIHTLDRYAAIKTAVLQETPKQSIIVVDRADKIFFPDRKIITPLRSPATYDALRAVSLRVPVYYYGITMTDTDLAYHNTTLLLPTGLTLRSVRLFGNETLYQFIGR